MPEGDTVVEAGDEVFCLAATQNIRNVMHELRRMDKPVRRVMIAGGGNIGLRLARALERDYTVKIIEHNNAARRAVAAPRPALVLQGDVTDESLLEAKTSRRWIFRRRHQRRREQHHGCLLAKRMGARSVVALINRRSYVDLLQAGQIDIAISPAQATIGTLLAHVRRGDIVEVHCLRRGAAEALEAVVHGDGDPAAWSGGVEEIELPKGATIGAIVRRLERPAGERIADLAAKVRDAKVLMAHHDP